VEEGSTSLEDRARAEVARLVAAHEPSRLSDSVCRDLEERMLAAAKACGMDALPDRRS
jgi:trimethylamine:corrinoid methyltransferase-like protein